MSICSPVPELGASQPEPRVPVGCRDKTTCRGVGEEGRQESGLGSQTRLIDYLISGKVTHSGSKGANWRRATGSDTDR